MLNDRYNNDDNTDATRAEDEVSGVSEKAIQEWYATVGDAGERESEMDNTKQPEWLEGFAVYFGGWYQRSLDDKRYRIIASDFETNEIQAQQEGSKHLYWIGTSQDFANAFVKVA